jgi:hypothetical protein
MQLHINQEITLKNNTQIVNKVPTRSCKENDNSRTTL